METPVESPVEPPVSLPDSLWDSKPNAAATSDRALPQQPSNWTTEHVQQWLLADKVLKQYAVAFEEEDVNGRQLLDIVNNDVSLLVDFGITKVTHQRRVKINLEAPTSVESSAQAQAHAQAQAQAQVEAGEAQVGGENQSHGRQARAFSDSSSDLDDSHWDLDAK